MPGSTRERWPNMPGSTLERWPNWLLALPIPLEELESSALAERIATSVYQI